MGEERQNRIRQVEEKLDRHLEIYANNGKELKALKEEVARSYENLTQNLGELRSDMKSMQINLASYASTLTTLVDDKKKKDGWIEWIQKAVLQIFILAVALAIGIKLK